MSAVTVIVQAAVPEQPPLQPENAKLLAADAANVTCVFAVKVAEQVVGQSIPAGVLVTVPAFAVGILTVSVNWLGGGGGFRKPVQPVKKIPQEEQTKATAERWLSFIMKTTRDSGFG
ncbi:MAG TPA: hypothetical protein VMU05_25475 [Dongiaceae bacterium]|nr:hypothetical protein [Dongiaceae bacterium]